MSEQQQFSEISFTSLNLPETLARGIADAGFERCTPIQAGTLPRALAGLDVADLEVTAVKCADDGHGVIVRVADTHGCGGAGTLRWQNQTFSVEVAPFEVATFRLIEQGGRWEIVRGDMLER